jgi:hypothetical protein
MCRAVECRLEIGLGVVAAEIMAAGADFADRIERLAVFRQIDTFGNLLRHAELVLSIMNFS